MSDLPDSYSVNMPKRNEVIYSDEACEISFEVEVGPQECVLWEQSLKLVRGNKAEYSDEIARVLNWLSKKFPPRLVVVDKT